MSYISPIKLSTIPDMEESWTDKFAKYIAGETDKLILESCMKVVCDVNEKELIKALQYDRGQYEKGYSDGKRDAQPHWVSVEEPPQSGQECFTAYRSILRSDPEWLYDICYYTDDLARDCPLMDGAEHRPGWYRYESEYGDVECHPKYWMPIEPPQEVQE